MLVTVTNGQPHTLGAKHEPTTYDNKHKVKVSACAHVREPCHGDKSVRCTNAPGELDAEEAIMVTGLRVFIWSHRQNPRTFSLTLADIIPVMRK